MENIKAYGLLFINFLKWLFCRAEYKKNFDLIEKLSSLQAENIKLKEENRTLKEQLELVDELEFRNNAFFSKKTWIGPYCSCCFQVDKKTVSMIIDWNYSDCPKCKNRVNFTGKKEKMEGFVPNYPWI